MFEDVDIAVYLVINGFYPNWLDENGATILHVACANGRADVIQTLLEHGCDKNIVDNWGKRAQDVAADLGYWNIVSYLNSVS